MSTGLKPETHRRMRGSSWSLLALAANPLNQVVPFLRTEVSCRLGFTGMGRALPICCSYSKRDDNFITNTYNFQRRKALSVASETAVSNVLPDDWVSYRSCLLPKGWSQLCALHYQTALQESLNVPDVWFTLSLWKVALYFAKPISHGHWPRLPTCGLWSYLMEQKIPSRTPGMKQLARSHAASQNSYRNQRGQCQRDLLEHLLHPTCSMQNYSLFYVLQYDLEITLLMDVLLLTNRD